MAIYPYKIEVSPKVHKTFYTVVAEAINEYSGMRIQKKRRGIPSKPKAQMIYKELWSMCRYERPDAGRLKKWGELIEKYITHIEGNIRSLKNPNGFSPQLLRTKKSRLAHLKNWHDMHIDLLTPHFVTEQLDAMELNGAGRSHTNHLLKEIKCVFSFALHLGAIKANPFAGFKMRKISKKRKEALTHQETQILIHEAHKQSHPFYYIWVLTLTLGLRRSELAGLKWIDIDFDQNLVYLRRQLIPREGEVPFLKDREDRVVAIPLHIIPVLKELKLKAQTDYVIETNSHEWKSGQQAAVLKRFCKAIGIKEVTHHQLRATHITLALIDGIPLGIVKENVGHSKLSTTDEYFRSAGINMRGQTDGLRIFVPAGKKAEVIPLKKG